MPAPHDAARPAPEAVAAVLDASLGGSWAVRPLHASSFADTWQARQGDHRLFVKSAPGARAAPLQAEADGLAALAATRTIRVPAQAAWHDGGRDGTAVLALEWLDMSAPDPGFGARLGRALASLHRTPVEPPRYGWHQDNFIGATPQANPPTAGGSLDDWLSFVAGARLGAMRDRLAAHDGARRHAGLCDAVDAVIVALPDLFCDASAAHTPRPSLIHGDLWCGNWGMLVDGTPVIFDPAVSASDAEAELAMMELFGAPPPGFWAAYRAGAGVHVGYERRRGLYHFYHLLNHALLFGGGYVAQAMGCAWALAGRAHG